MPGETRSVNPLGSQHYAIFSFDFFETEYHHVGTLHVTLGSRVCNRDQSCKVVLLFRIKVLLTCAYKEVESERCCVTISFRLIDKEFTCYENLKYSKEMAMHIRIQQKDNMKTKLH